MLRLFGFLFFIFGLLLVATIIGWFIGVWFMLIGALMMIFGGGRRVVEVHYHHDDEQPRRPEKATKAKPLAAPQMAAPRPDAATDFAAAILLYQRHKGYAEPGDAIRMLAADALRREGFLK